MKKLCFGIMSGLVLLGASLGFVGCGNTPQDDYEKYTSEGFTAVCSVEYQALQLSGSTTYSNKLITLNSYWDISYSEVFEVPENEWLGAYNYYTDFTMNATKDNKPTIGRYVQQPHWDVNYVREILSFSEFYLYVKILSSDDLEIIDIDGNHYRIHTNYYKIEYFKN